MADRAAKVCRVRKAQVVQQVHRVAVADRVTKACRVRKVLRAL